MQFGELAADRGVSPAHDISEIGEGVLHEIAGSVSRAKLVISVAAGVPVSALRAGLGGVNRQKPRRGGDQDKRQQHRPLPGGVHRRQVLVGC